eukprot:Clim_evm81s153 gene=Clim_evmTU81s153
MRRTILSRTLRLGTVRQGISAGLVKPKSEYSQNLVKIWGTQHSTDLFCRSFSTTGGDSNGKDPTAKKDKGIKAKVTGEAPLDDGMEGSENDPHPKEPVVEMDSALDANDAVGQAPMHPEPEQPFQSVRAEKEHEKPIESEAVPESEGELLPDDMGYIFHKVPTGFQGDDSLPARGVLDHMLGGGQPAPSEWEVKKQEWIKLCRVPEKDKVMRGVFEIKSHDPKTIGAFVELMQRAAIELHIGMKKIGVVERETEKFVLLKAPFVKKQHKRHYETRSYHRKVEIFNVAERPYHIFKTYLQEKAPQHLLVSIDEYEIVDLDLDATPDKQKAQETAQKVDTEEKQPKKSKSVAA